MTIEDWYAILEVEETATEKEIKRAYRKMAARYHPDRNAAEGASEQFQRVTRAYQTLSDAAKRTHFDWLLEQKRGPRSPHNVQPEQPDAVTRARKVTRQRRYAQDTARRTAAQSRRAQRRHEPFLQAVEEQVALEAQAYQQAARRRAKWGAPGLLAIGALLLLAYAVMHWW